MKKIFYLATVLFMGLSFTACSSDDDDNSSNNTSEAQYKDKSYGQKAIDACVNIVSNLNTDNNTIAKASLTTDQESYLREVITNVVDKVIIPTYTNLANDVEDLEKTLNGLTVNTITQTQVDKACTDFKKAREHWERSEAFLGGAASDFGIDPTIDSWPLDRSELLDYFKSGMKAEIEDESSILGFHALEFILFRNGQNRKVDEFKSNDTYTNFTSVSGADELKYAQQVCKLLKERCFQLQVSWEGKTTANASRVQVIEKAGLPYMTGNSISYRENLIGAGTNTKSNFTSLKSAIEQVLSATEGSCVGIANEVGTAKIANPFTRGDIAYVESPYSYNSITDFQDNIRSIRNVWFGSLDGNANGKCFYNFFAEINKADINTNTVNAINGAIEAIGKMPAPFVKYCSILWNKNFDDPTNWKSTTSE